jgi:hypothetical protein
MLVCGFDRGFDTRIRGAAASEEPSVFVCTRNHVVITVVTTTWKYLDAIGCAGVRGSVLRRILCSSLLARINSLRWQKNSLLCQRREFIRKHLNLLMLSRQIFAKKG